MGNSSNKKTALIAKVETAEKTGLLNLSDQNLKPTSFIWTLLSDPGKFHKLRSLDISNNTQLKALPVEVYSLVSLKTVQASNCGIQRVNSLEMLTKLQMLRLDQNELDTDNFTSSLPQSLQQLHLRNNHFTLVTANIIVLKGLTHLDLSNNQLVDAGGVECLVSLQVLLLDNNQLRDLPLGIEKLTHIQHISLQNNRLQRMTRSGDEQSIPKDLLASTPLERLDLKGNHLQQADVMSFEGVDAFLERRKGIKNKAIQGGAMIDLSLFGLD